MPHYTVCTPQYMTYGDPWTLEPPEYGADCTTVDAPNKRAAKVIAVRQLRAEGSEWMQDQASDKASPFTGLQVFSETCEHGVCHCDIHSAMDGWEMCQICYDTTTEELSNEPAG